MSPDIFLTATTEVAIGMAGFAGIVVAIRRVNVSEWDASERIMLETLLGLCASATFFSLMPIVLFNAQLTDETIWRVGSFLMLSVAVFMAIYRYRQTIKIGSEFNLPLPMRIVALFMLAILLANVVLLETAWPYLVGVLVLLANAFVVFLVLLLGGNDSDGV